MEQDRTNTTRIESSEDDAKKVESATTMGGYIKRRIITGLLATLPLFVTLWIIQFTYTLLITSILTPILLSILRLFGLAKAEDMPAWWDMIVAPGLVLMLLGLLLFIMGEFAPDHACTGPSTGSFVVFRSSKRFTTPFTA